MLQTSKAVVYVVKVLQLYLFAESQKSNCVLSAGKTTCAVHPTWTTKHKILLHSTHTTCQILVAKISQLLTKFTYMKNW